MELYEKIDQILFNQSVGGGIAFDVAKAQSKILQRYIDFKKVKRIMDFGCGIGRTMPMLFAEAKNKNLRIDGCDISYDFIETCRQLYHEYPFTFYKIFSQNDHYKQYSITQQHDKIPTLYYDAAYSFSVFTHLNLLMAEQALRLVHDILKKNGIYYFTFFRLDSGSRSVINSSDHSEIPFRFTHKVGNHDLEYFAIESDPLAFAALDQKELETLINKCGFNILNFEEGAWRSAVPRENIHDAYSIQKR